MCSAGQSSTEAQRRVVPTRVQPHQARNRRGIQSARGIAFGRHEDCSAREHLQPQARKAAARWRKRGALGDESGIRRCTSSSCLVPVQLERRRAGAGRPHARAPTRNRPERLVGRQRHANIAAISCGYARRSSPSNRVRGCRPAIAFAAVRNAPSRHARQVQVARAAARKVDFLHRRERRAQRANAADRSGGLQEGLELDVVGHCHARSTR